MNKTRFSFRSWLSHFSSPKAPALPLSAVLPLALLVALASTSFAASAAGAGAAHGVPAKVVISQVAVKGKKVTIAGQVKLPVDTAAQRQRTRVVLSLIDSSGKVEQLSAKIDAKRHFKATKTTKLIGQLTAVALVKIGGKPSGPQVSKRFAGPLAGSGAGGGTKAGGGAGGAGGALPPIPPPGTPPLVGLFKLEQGTQATSGKFTGTYFRMVGIFNGESTAINKEYTLLTPGTDGGLHTDIYQPPPTPAFSGGNALADRIVQPQAFLGNNFSIATAANDLQSGTPVPLATIYAFEGKIGGQISYWDAQWGTLSFNQGSPKPNGSTVGTAALTGTYNAVTSHFAFGWTSLIEGGPFGGMTGEWHLEGTFVPAT